MKCERFEDLPVWKSAMELGDRVYALTRQRGFGRPGDLADQLRRAALSVSNNIAEGFEQGTTAGLLSYLYVARGSAGEVRSMLHFCDQLPELAGPASEISNLRSLAESCSRQIRAWAASLQDSPIPGQRHLTQRTRQAHQRKQRADALWKQIKAVQSKYGTPPDTNDGAAEI